MIKNACFLLVIFVLAFVTGTVVAESEAYEYLMYLSFSTKAWIHDFTDAPIDESRAVHAQTNLGMDVMTAVLILTDEIETGEEDFYVGARVTFDKPLEAILDTADKGGYAILEPEKVEIVGVAYYGKIVEVGDDFVIFELWNEHYAPSGNNSRYRITPYTQMIDNTAVQPGSSYIMIVDDEGVVLAMDERKG